MDIYQLPLSIETALSKSLTVDAVILVKADVTIGTVKVISQNFDGLDLSDRIQLIFDTLMNELPVALKEFDITFVPLTKAEHSEWTDYTELTESQQTKDKFAAKDL